MKNGRLEGLSLVAMLALVALGTVAIWSAGNARAEAVFHTMWRSNLVTAGVGLVLYALLARLDYRRVFTFCAVPGYVFSLAILTLVLLVGTERFGGRRWLGFFQPSEISKLLVLVFLAFLLPRLAARGRGLKELACATLALAVPVLLILLEPDLGTALALVPACLVMVFLSRLGRKGLVTVLSVGAVGALAILGAVAEAERPGVSPERRAAILRLVPLRPHQVQRVKVFLYPESDVTGAGYNLRQARISIGSGGFSGKGIGRGETNHLKYLPQVISMNDFIFCVWAEETGFVGSVVLLGLFALLLLPCAAVARRATDDGGRLFALGFATLVFAHVFINLAMSLGLVPITGLPLPFVSSGRTFLVTVLAGFGFIQSISLHGKENN